MHKRVSYVFVAVMRKSLSGRSSNQKIQANRESRSLMMKTVVNFGEICIKVFPMFLLIVRILFYPPAHMYLHRILFWNVYMKILV